MCLLGFAELALDLVPLSQPDLVLGAVPQLQPDVLDGVLLLRPAVVEADGQAQSLGLELEVVLAIVINTVGGDDGNRKALGQAAFQQGR